eukprot:4576226-Amphidinium_carterae.2
MGCKRGCATQERLALSVGSSLSDNMQYKQSSSLNHHGLNPIELKTVTCLDVKRLAVSSVQSQVP